MVMPAVTAHSTRAPLLSAHSACAAARLRVVWPASSRSHRWLSSSPRSNRVLVSRPHTAPRTISVIETLKTVKPATVSSRGAGPKSALVALFAPYAEASAFRSAVVR